MLARHPERVTERLGSVCELVRGDVGDRSALARALEGCAAVHVSLNGAGDWDLERRGAAAVAAVARDNGVQRISLISGASVCEDNAWFPMTRAKLEAERAVQASGVACSIFRCTMFMETLPMYVRDGKAMLMGKQPNAWWWIAADDYAAMVARALELPEAAGKVFHIRGPEALTMEQALDVYRRICAPEAKPMRVPLWLLQVMAWMPGRAELRNVGLPIMRYFARARELGDPAEANAMLGAATTTLPEWCRKRAAQPAMAA